MKQNVSIASTQKGFKAKALRYIEESRLGLRSVKSGRQRSAIASGSALSMGFMADESPISARNKTPKSGCIKLLLLLCMSALMLKGDRQCRLHCTLY